MIRLFVAAGLLVALCGLPASQVVARKQPTKGKAPADPKPQWTNAVEQAAGYLKARQAADGSWSRVDVNPGMADGSGPRGLYYDLMTMARCLTELGEPTTTDANGITHNWRLDILSALANRQHKDGSWQNDISAWMEAEPDLCTVYALIALSYCRPQ